MCALTLTGAAAAAEFPPLPEGAFSIVALPDTQAYSANAPDVFEAEMQWILDNLEAQNIVFVSHVGDIVDKNTAPEQWAVAEQSLAMLHGKVPYGLGVGIRYGHITRHAAISGVVPARDSRTSTGTAVVTRTANSWQTFSAAGMEFLILHLECNAPDDVLAWADGVIAAHLERRVIATTHMYLGPL